MITEVIAVLAIASSGGQAKDQNAMDKGVTWLKSAWTSVQKEGKPAAERVIRQFPERFKSIPKQAENLQKRAKAGLQSMKLEEKKEIAQELWRVRHCLNLMVLMDSGVLEQLTGIDSKTLKAAVQQVNRLQAQISGK